jgi:hypothetical protein
MIFANDCELLKHFDTNNDGIISDDELWVAEELMCNEEITEEEFGVVYNAHNAGSIDAVCPGCYASTPTPSKGNVVSLNYPANAIHGETITIKASVLNEGGTSGEFSLRLIAAPQLLLVTRYVGWIAPYRFSVLESLSVTMPSSGSSANLIAQCIRHT